MTRSPRTHRYEIAGLVLQVPGRLAGLEESNSAPDLIVTFGSDAPPSGRGVRRFEADGRTYLHVTALECGLMYDFPGFGAVTVEPSRHSVTCYPAAGTASHTLWHLLLDQVLPLHLASTGHLVLHASSVAIPGAEPRGLLFLGESGSGKSSTAAAVSLAGATLLGDDFARIVSGRSGPETVPANVGIRLWGDAADALAPGETGAPVSEYRAKVRLRPEGVRVAGSSRPVAIGALVFLGPRGDADAAPELVPVPPAQAFIRVFQQAFRLEVDGAAANRDALDRVSGLVDRVPALELSLPDDVTNLMPSGVVALRLISEYLGSPVAIA